MKVASCCTGRGGLDETAQANLLAVLLVAVKERGGCVSVVRLVCLD